MHERTIDTDLAAVPVAETGVAIEDVFARFLERSLAFAERANPTPKERAHIDALRAAEIRAEPLSAANSEAATELLFAQFRSEPLTHVAGFSDDVLRATLADIVAECVTEAHTPSVILGSRSGTCGVGITVPFEAEMPIAPGLPPEVARLFGAMNEINAVALRTRRRISDPLDRPFEWLLAATTTEYRHRFSRGDAPGASSLFQVMAYSNVEVARRRGYRTVVAHTNDLVARTLLDMGLVVEATLPYRDLEATARGDIPGNLSFMTANLDRLLSALFPAGRS